MACKQASVSAATRVGSDNFGLIPFPSSYIKNNNIFNNTSIGNRRYDPMLISIVEFVQLVDKMPVTTRIYAKPDKEVLVSFMGVIIPLQKASELVLHWPVGSLVYLFCVPPSILIRSGQGHIEGYERHRRAKWKNYQANAHRSRFRTKLANRP